MAHVRKQIRDYVAVLLTGYVYDRFGIVLLDRSGSKLEVNNTLLPTGSIYKSRHYALDDSKLPAILVYTESDITNLATIGNRTLAHNLELGIDILNKGASGSIFENVEQFAADIVWVLENDYDFGGLVKSCELASMQTDTNSQGERTVASAQLRFNVRYVTAIGDCEVSI